jgi:hypothetical protein
MLLLLNAEERVVTFKIPAFESVSGWQQLVDTSVEDPSGVAPSVWRRGDAFALNERSVAVFRGMSEEETGRWGT